VDFEQIALCVCVRPRADTWAPQKTVHFPPHNKKSPSGSFLYPLDSIPLEEPICDIEAQDVLLAVGDDAARVEQLPAEDQH
jgi:hypothetical protein